MHDLEKKFRFEYLIISKDEYRDIYRDMLTKKDYRFSIEHIAHLDNERSIDKVIIFGRALDEEVIEKLKEKESKVYFDLLKWISLKLSYKVITSKSFTNEVFLKIFLASCSMWENVG